MWSIRYCVGNGSILHRAFELDQFDHVSCLGISTTVVFSVGNFNIPTCYGFASSMDGGEDSNDNDRCITKVDTLCRKSDSSYQNPSPVGKAGNVSSTRYTDLVTWAISVSPTLYGGCSNCGGLPSEPRKACPPSGPRQALGIGRAERHRSQSLPCDADLARVVEVGGWAGAILVG